MRKWSLFILATMISLVAKSANKDSVFHYALPDSVKAVQFMAEINVQAYNKKKFCSAGIKTDAVSLSLQNYYGRRRIAFSSQASLNNITRGLNTGFDLKSFDVSFSYDWQLNETYKLLISQATDSAENFSLYTGYIFLPKENKWKWVGTVKIENRWNTIRQPSFFYINGRKQNISVATSQVWCQRQNGSWKNMKETASPSPTVNLYSHIDSTQQALSEIRLIDQAIASNKTDTKQNKDGVYYTILKEGTGRQVQLTDTVVAYYKGYLFSDETVFDQTKDKPATFPLQRLIRGWQIGVPLCKVGGKIKLVIPSGVAYSIRTRAAKIPPNSILVFEVEVVDAKESK